MSRFLSDSLFLWGHFRVWYSLFKSLIQLDDGSYLYDSLQIIRNSWQQTPTSFAMIRSTIQWMDLGRPELCILIQVCILFNSYTLLLTNVKYRKHVKKWSSSSCIWQLIKRNGLYYIRDFSSISKIFRNKFCKISNSSSLYTEFDLFPQVKIPTSKIITPDLTIIFPDRIWKF